MQQVPLSITLEVFGGDGDWRDCFKFYNPHTRAGLDGERTRWAAVVFHAAELALWELRCVVGEHASIE